MHMTFHLSLHMYFTADVCKVFTGKTSPYYVTLLSDNGFMGSGGTQHVNLMTSSLQFLKQNMKAVKYMTRLGYKQQMNSNGRLVRHNKPLV